MLVDDDDGKMKLHVLDPLHKEEVLLQMKGLQSEGGQGLFQKLRLLMQKQ